MHKFKIGQKVLCVYNTNPNTEEMQQFLGKIVTIAAYYNEHSYPFEYRIEEDNKFFIWNECCFQCWKHKQKEDIFIEFN